MTLSVIAMCLEITVMKLWLLHNGFLFVGARPPKTRRNYRPCVSTASHLQKERGGEEGKEEVNIKFLILSFTT